MVAQHSGYEPGVASIAAPIRDMTNRVVAAINISAVALLTSDAELDGPLKAEVLATAEAISRDSDTGGTTKRTTGRTIRRPSAAPPR